MPVSAAVSGYLLIDCLTEKSGSSTGETRSLIFRMAKWGGGGSLADEGPAVSSQVDD